MAAQSDRILPKDAEGTSVPSAASALMMDMDRVVDADPDTDVPEEDIYADRETGETTLHHIFDPQSGLSYLVLRGKDIAGNETRLRKEMETYSLDEILDEVAKAKKKAKQTAVYRLGIAAPAKLDRKVFDALVEAMHDPDRSVRHAAVWATTYSAWKEFEKPLAELRDSDKDKEVREDAGIVLQAMKEEADGEG